ncbi:unnamed protein product [Ectocarpus sp. 4 AP-2014]
MNFAGRQHCLVLPSTGCTYGFEVVSAITCCDLLWSTMLHCTAILLGFQPSLLQGPTVASQHGVFKDEIVIHLPRVTFPPNISWPSGSRHMQLHTSMLCEHCFSFRHSRRPFHASILCSLTLHNRLHVFLRVSGSTLLTTPTLVVFLVLHTYP